LFYRDEIYEDQLVALLGLKDKKQIRLYYLEAFVRDKLNNIVYPNGKHKVALIFAEVSFLFIFLLFFFVDFSFIWKHL
jgi:hypothetical protein